jgi:hypothetical protein
VFGSLDSLYKALGQATLSNLRKSFVLEARDYSLPGEVSDQERPIATAQIEKYSPDRIQVSLKNGGGRAFLVVANSFSKFWKCKVDGIEREILPAYGCFWAVPLNGGERKVEFEYDPPYGH